MMRKNSKNEFDDMADIFKLANVSPKVKFDCGANIGFVTHKFLNKFKEAFVLSFEPNPLVFKDLHLQYADNEKVKCFNLGIGSESGELEFNINKNSGTSSFLNATEYHKSNIASRTINKQTVQVSKIDDILKNENLGHIDILKLDIEGFEIEAMKGIADLSKRVSLIFAEVNLIPTYEGQPLINDVISYAHENGFTIVNFYGINENQHHQAMITNLLFMSTDFRNKIITNGFTRSFSI